MEYMHVSFASYGVNYRTELLLHVNALIKQHLELSVTKSNFHHLEVILHDMHVVANNEAIHKVSI